jgi:hypothetical protein
LTRDRRGQASRRHLLQGLGALALLPAAAGAARAADAPPPNILFILADDMGYADLGVYGQRDHATPELDRLAAQGIRFTQGYANSAVCSATRFGRITGRYQYRLRGGLEEVAGYYTDLLANRAEGFLRQQRPGQPFLLSLHFWSPRGWRTTPSSSSPATTAANASPTPGPSPARSPSCWKAASACPRCCAGRRAWRRAR